MHFIRVHLLFLQFFLIRESVGFIPQKWKSLYGALGVSHEEQTEIAIKQLWTPWFGLNNDQFTAAELYGMNNAIEEIASANANVDNDQTDGSLHFDGESFIQAQARLLDLAQQAIQLTKQQSYSGARKSIGQALHTLQDFYSHSNWIELLVAHGAELVPHPGVGVSGAMLHPLLWNVSTCNQCDTFRKDCGGCENNLLMNGLTTGYYSGEPDYQKPQAGKCSHGGQLDGSSTEFGVGITKRGQGINKDSTSCLLSPHRDMHHDAVGVSINATMIYLTDEIFKQLTTDEVKILFGVQAKKGATGMSLKALWGTVKDIVKLHKRQDFEPVQKLRAASAEHHTHTFIMADDIHDHGRTLLQAAAPHKIHPIHIVGRDIPTNNTHEQIWRDIAKCTGGHLLKVCENDTSAASEFLEMISPPGHVEVLSVAGATNGNGTMEFSFPLDSSLESVLITASGISTFDLFFPNGSRYPVEPSEDKGTHVKRLAANVAFNMTSVTTTGIYRIAFNSVTDYSLSVSGQSKLYLSSFNFVELAGRPGHEGRFSILDSPLSGERKEVEAIVHGNFTSGKFEFRTKDDMPLAEQDSIKIDDYCKHHGTRFQGNTTEIPASDFMVYFKGINHKGEPFQRARLYMVSPTRVQINMPRIISLKVGQTENVTVEIVNRNNITDTFDLFAVDSENIVKAVSASSILLDAGASGNLAIQLQPTVNATIGVNHLVVSAKGKKTSGNVGVQTIMIEPEQAPIAVKIASTVNHYFASEAASLIKRLKKGQGKL
ncbi:hypothetical protein TWF694_009057 [Orbilia ellipsospora]|uniref:Uncharacterized protein n=1 Tax=Orbilia ellipsospora TaxID=2528407 RepID=A0AAV9XDU4_9PEZI